MKSGDRTMTIRSFVLIASVIVSVLFFGGTYYANSRVFDASIKDNALQNSDTLAQLTFNSMFQIMSSGWTRPQVLEFIRSTRKVAANAANSVDIYRGDIVARRFGPIEQPAMDEPLRSVFRTGEPARRADDNHVRYVFPLKAQDRCLRCHTNARVGDVLGAIDVRQDLGPTLHQAKHDFFLSLALIAPIPFLIALIVTVFVNRRIDSSLNRLEESVSGINSVSDLKNLTLRKTDFRFAEVNRLFGNFETLAHKLRTVVVDKDLLEFEIKLLEKFIITSDVVRDWHEYVNRLLVDISQVINVYALFSIFRIEEEVLDLDVFWRFTPSEETKLMLEAVVRCQIKKQSIFGEATAVNIRHHVADMTRRLPELDAESMEVKVKSLLLDTPKIGGIVGIGVNVDLARDETRALVMDSILSTLLNVIGSVKAIYKYTRDLEYYATRDPLTRLYNQRVFWELLTYEILRAERHDHRFCLLMIDLDNFKLVNDTYGHTFGDNFLKKFADVIHQALRAGDVLARYAGDEFVVILPETGLEDASLVANRILECASNMFIHAPDGSPVHGSVSIGISQYPTHARDARDLFLFADNMMYAAKARGKGQIGIPTEEDMVEIFRSMGEKSLVIANAIDNRKVVPYFQPILRLHDRRIEAIEVLSRIRLDDGRIIGAADFVEIAERIGVVHKLDALVIQMALYAVRDAGYKGYVFINVSPRSLAMAEFGPTVRRAVRDCGIEPGRVVFEITERDTLKNTAHLAKLIAELKRDGFRFAIDDFGSGFSSYQYLKRLPIDFVKIEGEFVANVVADPKDWAFVRSIASLAQALGIRTVAEHVESREVLEKVIHAGIDLAQGLYISEPLAAIPEECERPETVGAGN